MTVASRFKQVGVVRSCQAVERSAHNGRNTLRVAVEHDRPPADDRRRGDVAHSGSLWSIGRHLLLDVENGTVREKWHYGSDSGRVHTTLLKRNPIMDSISRRQLDTVMALSGNLAA